MIYDRLYQALQSQFGGRLYRVRAPDGAVMPYAVMSSAGAVEEAVVAAGQLYYQRWRVQIMIVAADHKTVLELRDAVIPLAREVSGYVEQGVDLDGFEQDTKRFTWILDFSYRN